MKLAKFTLARRVVLLVILGLFFFQLFRSKILIGGLTGSLILHWVNLLDLFAFLESALSSRSFQLEAFYSALPVLIFYLIMGRAFCGWVCPLDLVFRGVNRMKQRSKNLPAWTRGALLAPAGFLIFAALAQIPFFASHVSPITNFYRSISATFFWAGGLPGEISVLSISILILGGFLLLEFLWPRLWCKNLCPTGKTYGLFNRLSFLHVAITGEECRECQECRKACYMGVKILPGNGRTKIRDSSCIICGRCVEACSAQGKILKMRFGR
ncbi:MAG: 4Fe-4S binding protein [Thermodesulfobacteriota bacterium]|nr:4Fe-4S binding protein [Thermodesulfobacteriota bacterium]